MALKFGFKLLGVLGGFQGLGFKGVWPPSMLRKDEKPPVCWGLGTKV